ncbi:MAG: MBL fold metallo-hydrolase [Candidatus Methanomethylophilus sp.]|jgi:L-ascorbate metabolism protein UlaG (beta-lactamase superfamily)|nr:MBL fold metallo-hydrolase [Methanomethylophilus sp.]MCI2074223.1 MBL fold metallo-hydrolase [Methanomethylophilus sp.]MCI2092980.1 MBL fold metallo-hydrolase [Methanomethylophilus sp.]WII09412.1 MBL fold metallo-hydrolase [Methanomassiliicoccales archaeon LGM-DZ1]
MYIRWFGYSCFLFSDDSVRVVTDPHDGRSIGIAKPAASADVALCTHNSYERNCFRSLTGKHKDFMEALGRQECGCFSFEGLPSFADASGGKERGRNSVYMFEMDGLRIVFCGALGDIPGEEEIARMKGADIVFVPVGEFGTLPIARADEMMSAVSPKVIVPVGYRTGGITLPLSPLSSYAEGKDPDSFVHVGNEVELTAGDIADFTGYWIFDQS